MIPYIIMLVIIIFCIITEAGSYTEKKKKMCLKVALLPVFILIVFKSETVGSDTANYYRIFNYINDNGIESLTPDYLGIEIGYKYFNFFLGKISQDPIILYIALGIIIYITLYHFINQTAQRKCLALLFFITLGFFQFAMSGVRQTIAICIILWSYNFIKRRKLVYFAAFIALAMLFHKSAILFAPAYLIANMKLCTRNISMMLVGMIVLFSVSDILLLSVADVMDYNYGIEETGNGYLFFFIVCAITYLCLKNKTKLIRQNHGNLIVFNINFISLALWTVRLISRTAERVSLYFMPYTYIALEEYLSSCPVERRRVHITFSIILSCALFIYRISEQPALCEFKFC